MKKWNAIDLFSGCGGLSEGFMQTGLFNFIAHVEWEKPMVTTLRNNLMERWNYSLEEAMESVIHFDIQKTEELMRGNWNEDTEKSYVDNAKIIKEKGMDGVIDSQVVDIIIGGPPCQAYSIAGRAQDANSMKNDYRNYLFESFVKVVNHYKPKAFIFENVPGMLSAKPGDELVINRIYKAFKDIGYEIRKPSDLKNSVYSSVDYHVPQDRKRVIICGFREDSLDLVETFYQHLTNLKSSESPKTVGDAIRDLPKLYPLDAPYKKGNRNYSHDNCETCQYDDHIVRYHNERDIGIFKKWITQGMNDWSNEEKKDFYFQMTGRKTNHNKYRSLEWDKPSPTIVSHLYKDGLMFIHPDDEQARSITVREAALLQSFPKDYIFSGSMAYQYKMIGNAVPVNFSKYIGLALAKTLEE